MLVLIFVVSVMVGGGNISISQSLACQEIFCLSDQNTKFVARNSLYLRN